MFDDNFDTALFALGLAMNEAAKDYDCEWSEEPDLMDIEGLCVPLNEYDAYEYDTVPCALTFD